MFLPRARLVRAGAVGEGQENDVKRLAAGLAVALLLPPLAPAATSWWSPVPDSFYLMALSSGPAAPPGSSAFARLDVGLDKTQTLVIRTFGLPDGTYSVTRSGWLGKGTLGSFTVESDGMGKFWPEAPPGEDFTDWLLFGTWIEVLDGGDVLFSDYLDPPIDFFFTFGESSTLHGVRLIAVGDDLDARGRFLWTDVPGQHAADLWLQRLAPGPYIVEIGGVPELYVIVDEHGRGNLRLSLPVEQGRGQALIGPMGENVRVLGAAGDVVLSACMPGYGSPSHPPSAQKFQDQGDGAADGLSADFIRSGWSSLAGGSLAWQRDAAGAASVTVKLLPKASSTAPASPYDVFVGDTWIGDVGTPEGGANDPIEGTFAVAPELDLRGQRVEVRQQGYAALALIFPQSVPAALRTYKRDVRRTHRLRLDLLNPGIDLDADGTLRWRRLSSGIEKLTLEVFDLPAGSYDVVIDGGVVAEGALVVAEAGGSAAAEFTSLGEPASPLDFDVEGTLEIRASGSTTALLQQSLEH